MSSSDVRAFEELAARVAALEASYRGLETAFVLQGARLDAIAAAVLPRDVSGEVYGAAADHAGDREARAALVRRPPRPA